MGKTVFVIKMAASNHVLYICDVNQVIEKTVSLRASREMVVFCQYHLTSYLPASICFVPFNEHIDNCLTSLINITIN